MAIAKPGSNDGCLLLKHFHPDVFSYAVVTCGESEMIKLVAVKAHLCSFKIKCVNAKHTQIKQS